MTDNTFTPPQSGEFSITPGRVAPPVFVPPAGDMGITVPVDLPTLSDDAPIEVVTEFRTGLDDSDVDHTLSAATPADRLAERQRALEELTGESVAQVGRLEELLAASKEGVTVALVIKRHRFGIRCEADELGLSEHVAKELFKSLGRRMVISQDLLGAMDSADSAVRRDLRERAIKTKWGMFLPASQWDDFKARFVELRCNYYSALDDICTAIDDGTVSAWVTEQYTLYAENIWPARRKAWGSDADTAPVAFVEAVVGAALGAIPPVADVRSLCDYHYELGFVAAPEIESALEIATTHQGLNAALMEQVNEQRKTVLTDFIQSVRSSLCSHLAAAIEKVRGSVEGKPKVRVTTTNAFLRRINQLNDLNVVNDSEFARQLSDLQSFLVAETEEPRSGDELLAHLNMTLASVTESMAEPINDFDGVGA